MTLIIIAALVAAFILGALCHKWIVKEDLLIAEKVKVLVGQKLAAIKVEAAKAEGAVKAEATKIETKAGDGSCGIGGFPPCEEKKI